MGNIMFRNNMNRKSYRELKEYLEKILNREISLDELHDETPAYYIYAMYESSNKKEKKRIEKSILEILRGNYIEKQCLELSNLQDIILGDLAFLCEAFKIKESYMLLRSILDRGTLVGAKICYFHSKDTEKKVLRSLIIIQPPKLLIENVWLLYWKNEDPFFWDVAFIGLRRADIIQTIDLLKEGFNRWKMNSQNFNFPQALFDLANQLKHKEHVQRIRKELAGLDFKQRDIIRKALVDKGLDQNRIEEIFTTNAYDMSTIDNTKNFYIYYHSDMDGIGSCVLTIIYLIKECNFKRKNIITIPVDFDLEKNWKEYRIEQPAAILDFLYHKDAEFWCDHHEDPFRKNENFLHHYERRIENPRIFWDRNAPSNVYLIFSKWRNFFRKIDPDLYIRLKQMVEQITIIDSAKYVNVNQWYNCEFESLKIDLVLRYNRKTKYVYCNEVVEGLLRLGCKEFLKQASFQKKYKEARKAFERDFEESINSDRILRAIDGVVFYDSTKSSSRIFYRFFPYKFKPKSFYTVGIYQKRKKFEVSIGENPWSKPKNKIYIGSLCGAFGGGGHSSIGGITLDTYKNACEVSQRATAVLIAPK